MEVSPVTAPSWSAMGDSRPSLSGNSQGTGMLGVEEKRPSEARVLSSAQVGGGAVEVAGPGGDSRQDHTGAQGTGSGSASWFIPAATTCKWLPP